MVFSSVVFLFYFLPAVLLLYYTIGRIHITVRNFILLIASLFFYAWGEPHNLVLLLFSCVVNWAAALLISHWNDRRRPKRLVLILACIANLGMLFVFKYWDFTMGTVNAIFGREIVPLLQLALPIGISFFTFQALSYVIDVYRGDVQVQRSLWNVALYISLFPQLVAGPIVRYSTVEDQILHRSHSWQLFSEGAARFVVGFSKKLILANSFAIIADNIYELTRAGHQLVMVPASLAWLGSFAYTLQIFLDFSAYSDMAIGLGKMFGFCFEENFNYPYISCSIGEFWRRWHISLSTWFREYVYFPLGGSRMESIDMVIRNLFIVWLLTGMWHGAAWTFVLWGLLNFAFIMLERITLFEKRSGHRGLRHLYTLFVVNMGWVLFRAEDFYQLKEYLGNMFCAYGNPISSPYTWMFLREYAWIWIAGLLCCAPVVPMLQKKFCRGRDGKNGRVFSAFYPIALIGLFAVSVVYVSKSGYNPFIYFNF